MWKNEFVEFGHWISSSCQENRFVEIVDNVANLRIKRDCVTLVGQFADGQKVSGYSRYIKNF